MSTPFKPKHYWICECCAGKHGGTVPRDAGAITVIHGTCEYCAGKNQIEGVLIPWVDFDWPSDIQLQAKARLRRD